MNRNDLQMILDSDYAIPSTNTLGETTTELEGLLASTDAFLRENATEVLWQWVLRGLYEDSQLLALGDRTASYLSTGVGEVTGDSVFVRAFAALVLGGILIADQRATEGNFHQRKPFLSQDKVHTWFDAALGCFRAEQDRRGYVEEKGWAHALAHEADMLSDFARSRHLGAQELQHLLDATAEKMIEPCDRVLCFNEDERITQMLMDLLRRNLIGIDALDSWLDRIAHNAEGGHWGDTFGMEGSTETLNNARMNTRSFLRSLYFQLQIGSRTFRAGYLPQHFDSTIEVREQLIAATLGALRKMDRHYYAREDRS